MLSKCFITNCNEGIALRYSDNNRIAGSWLLNNGLGLRVDNSDGNELNWTLYAYSESYAIMLTTSSGNLICNNTFDANHGSTTTYDIWHVQAADYGFGNRWNDSDFGNWWSDWTSPDSDTDGIVDVPYVVDGWGSTKDYYPLTIATVPQFGALPIVMGMMVMLWALVRTGRSRRQ